jgi:hypothetical protein
MNNLSTSKKILKYNKTNKQQQQQQKNPRKHLHMTEEIIALMYFKSSDQSLRKNSLGKKVSNSG